MKVFLTLLGWVLFGLATAYFAQKRGRDPVIWFIIGLLLGVFGVILVLLLPSVKNQEAREQEEEIEDYEVHPIQLEPVHETNWWYIDKNQTQQGPVNKSEIKNLLEKGDLSDESYVWHEGMKEWQQIWNTPDIPEI